MGIIDSLIVFFVGLGIGGFGIHIGAKAVIGRSNLIGAIFTALLGAFVWSIFNFFISSMPLLGPLMALFAWLTVINTRYPGNWLKAILIALIAWFTVLLVLSILAAFGIGTYSAIGIPNA